MGPSNSDLVDRGRCQRPARPYRDREARLPARGHRPDHPADPEIEEVVRGPRRGVVVCPIVVDIFWTDRQFRPSEEAIRFG